MQLPDKEPSKTLEGIWSAYHTFRKIFERNVSFGHPNHPIDPTYTAPQAGIQYGAHNGLLDNIQGSWVEVLFSDEGPERCYHHLHLDVVTAAWDRNVRWLVWGIAHDDAGTAPLNSAINIYWKVGDAVAANYIDLRIAWVPIARDINAFHQAKVTLFFIPAVRG